MTPEKIIINPTGIDWENQDVCLLTNGGVLRLPNGESISNFQHDLNWADDNELTEVVNKRITSCELTEHAVICCQDYLAGFYELVNCGEYLSLRGFLLNRNAVCSVGSYTNSLEKYGCCKFVEDLGQFLKRGTDYCAVRPRAAYADKEGVKPETGWGPVVQSQIRIYKDRKTTLVLRLEWKDGTVRFISTNSKKVATMNSNYYTGFINDGDSLNWEDSSDESFNKFIEVSGFSVVTNDDEIQKNSVYLSSKRTLSKVFIQIIGEDVSTYTKDGKLGYVKADDKNYCYTCSREKYFSSTTTKTVNDFFEVFEEENSTLKTVIDSKYIYNPRGGSREKKDGITSIFVLEGWMGTSKGTMKTKETQANFIKEVWPTIHWNEDGVCWERRENLIICAAQSKYYQRAFIYDVGTKVRKVITKYIGSGWCDDREPKMLIPSLANGIASNFEQLEPSSNWNSEKGCYYISKPTKQKFWGDITVKELVKGTNIEWIMDNKDAFAGKEFCRFDNSMMVKVDDQFSENRLGLTALAVLATSGEPFLEQLLKNKQFNLYFTTLHDRGTNGSSIVDITRTKSQYKIENANIAYNGKEKSLKKMLGMTMSQIKTLNDSLVWTESKSSYYSAYKTHDGKEVKKGEVIIPDFTNTKKVLEIESLSQLDDKTFARVIKLLTTENTQNYSYNNPTIGAYLFKEYWEASGAMHDLLSHMTANQKLDFMEKYGNSVEEYKDYLRMRQQLIELQIKRPDDNIFDAAAYPLKPGNATKFIRFTPGMDSSAGRYTHRNTVDTEDDFKNYIAFNYLEERNGYSAHYYYGGYTPDKKAFKKDVTCEFITEHTGLKKRITGALLTMTHREHVKFLHDEIQRWFQLWHDEAEAELFQEALIRVKPLEWSDDSKEGELCIVAPKNAGEVRREGAVLSHCVASYVDPIIKGTENIMFIRRKDMVNEPFFTVDITNDGVIRQVHCYRNGNPNSADIARCYAATGREVYNTRADVIGFLKKWAKVMGGKVNGDTISVNYGALCALRK